LQPFCMDRAAYKTLISRLQWDQCSALKAPAPGLSVITIFLGGAVKAKCQQLKVRDQIISFHFI